MRQDERHAAAGCGPGLGLDLSQTGVSIRSAGAAGVAPKQTG
ncbi:MAG: hypothetical protein Q7T62_07085 [Undibacterium sp.]|nr:hypothetical protein [Undibacterium sp.]